MHVGCCFRIILTMTVLPLLFGACAAGGASPATDGAATVISVVDGDTIVVDVQGREEDVRLIGVDTPETKHPTRPVECFGKEASAHTVSLLPPGTARDALHQIAGFVLTRRL